MAVMQFHRSNRVVPTDILKVAIMHSGIQKPVSEFHSIHKFASWSWQITVLRLFATTIQLFMALWQTI